MSVLEIAEAFATAKVEAEALDPLRLAHRRGGGTLGSEYFTDHPTVPRDSIVAQLNMDMVGRGAATDITGETKEAASRRRPGYVQLVGSRRLSTELGDLIE